MKIPPGVSAGDFAEAIKQFEEAVGKEWVFTSDEDVALYRDAYSPFWGEPEERGASAAVAPYTVEQVQAVMKTANEYKIPVYPISTGKNLGYGGSAPNLSGSVVLDLKRMNRILDVSERNHSALVEPGVSYFDLYRYIQERKLKVWVDVPDPGWGSPIGNALDHGGGYLRSEFRVHFDSHCGMEVVLANGDLLRTGMGAMPAAQTWQQYKFGFGPWIDGMFSQSNFGVVTKMGLWLMPEPDAYLTGTVTVPKYEDLVPMVDVLTFLENSGISNGMPGLGSPILGGFMMPPRAPEVTAMLERDGVEGAELHKYAEDKGIPFWNCTVKFYGPAKAIRAQWEYAQEKFSAIPGAKFQDGEFYKLPLTPEQFNKVHKPRVRHPEPGDVFHRRAIAVESHANQRAHLVFANYSQNRRSDPRSEPGVLSGREGLRLAVALLQPADDVIGREVVHLPFWFSDHARRRHQQEKSRDLQASGSRRSRTWLGRISHRSRFQDE